MSKEIKLPSPFGENEYILKLIDKKTNEIKQEIVSHNVVLNQFWYYMGLPFLIELGSGTGTPQKTDTTLFKLEYITSNSGVTTEVAPDRRSVKTIYKFKIENLSHDKYITECGLADVGTRLITHCLFTDSQGVPLTLFVRTSDILEITIIYSVKIPEEANGFHFAPIDKGIWSRLYYNDTSRQHIGDIFPLQYTSVSWFISRPCLNPINKPSDDDPFLYNGLDLGDNTGLIGNRESKKEMKEGSNKIKYLNESFNEVTCITTHANNHYYSYLGINGLGYFRLPNHEVFTPYSIPKVQIGIGDGVTKSFKNPYNYFMENSDVVRLDGIIQKRTDYTIDFKNNFDKISELFASNRIKKIYSDSVYDHSADKGLMPLFMNSNPNLYTNLEYCDIEETGRGIEKNIPLYIELNEEEEVNTIHFYGFNDSGYTITISYKLEYSLNKIDYNLALEANDVICDVFGHRAPILTFPTKKAKYWKLTVTKMEREVIYIYNRGYGQSQDCYFGYVGNDQIVFDTPPAEGQIITLEVQTDIPYKTEKTTFNTGDLTVTFV